MPADYARAQDGFVEAVRALACAHGPLQERVGAAWATLSRIGRTHIPLELQGPFAEVERRWRAAPVRAGEDSAEAAARPLSDDEAVAAATWIVDTAFALSVAA
jgi:chromosome condensin MukBEF MukE localization factor